MTLIMYLRAMARKLKMKLRFNTYASEMEKEPLTP